MTVDASVSVGRQRTTGRPSQQSVGVRCARIELLRGRGVEWDTRPTLGLSLPRREEDSLAGDSSGRLVQTTLQGPLGPVRRAPSALQPSASLPNDLEALARRLLIFQIVVIQL